MALYEILFLQKASINEKRGNTKKIFNKQYNFVHFVLYFVFFKLHE